MGTKILTLLVAALAVLPLSAQDDQGFQSLLEQRTELSKQRNELQRQVHSLGRPSSGREGRVAELQRQLQEAQQAFRERRAELDRELREHQLEPSVPRNDELAQLRREVNDLLGEKREALRELRLGFYCSKCKRTQSEIEKATREAFAQHLSEVDGEPVPASPQEITAKEHEYDQKIEQVQRKIRSIEQQDAEALRTYDQRTAELRREETELGVEERAQLAELRSEISDARAQDQRSAHHEEARRRDQLRRVDEQIAGVEEQIGRLRFAPRPEPDLSYLLEEDHEKSGYSVFGSEHAPVDLDAHPDVYEPRGVAEPEPYRGTRAEDRWIDFDGDGEDSGSRLPSVREIDQAVGEGVQRAIDELDRLRSKAVAAVRDGVNSLVPGLYPEEPLDAQALAHGRVKSLAQNRLLELSGAERGMKRASSLVARLAPRATKAIEDGAHLDLPPEARFEREATPTAASSWGYLLDRHVIDHLLVPIRTYFSSLSEQPRDDYLGGNTR